MTDTTGKAKEGWSSAFLSGSLVTCIKVSQAKPAWRYARDVVPGPRPPRAVSEKHFRNKSKRADVLGFVSEL